MKWLDDLRSLRLSLCILLSALCIGVVGIADEPATDSEFAPDQFFDQQVQPILAENCFKCHGGEEKIKGGLRLTSRAGLLNGGDSGAAIDIGDVDASVLISAINYEDYEMPPSGKLPDEQRAILTKWVKLGAPWSKTTADFGFQGHSEDEHGPPRVNEKTKAWWSYQPVARPDVPAVGDQAWIANPIDAFILSKLEAHDLRPNAAADPLALLRRASYDLTGLPPSAAEVETFLANPSDEAYAAVIDRLLDSPRYGERWGRHWLDLVRYAESNSFERDGAKPHIWRYRDYVIDSLNEDKPYDQFIREQIAGDELDEATPASYIATGYYRIGQWDDEPTDQLQADFDALDDVLATTGQVFLGMTVNCARCHDHKIDPIPQADYYKMLAFFRNVQPYGHRSLDDANLRRFDRMTGEVVDEEVAKNISQARQKLERLVQNVENRVKPKLSNPEQEDFVFESNRVALVKRKAAELNISDEKVAAYEDALKQLQGVQAQDDELNGRTLVAFGVSEAGSEPPTTHIMIRGSAHALGDEVTPGFPSVLGFPDPEAISATTSGTSGRRTALANWIASPRNQLTARVIVNRLWQHHFGRGIVETPNDFGFQGAAPTHPELLDWLASELVDGGWQLKRMHKLMMTSSAYKMSSRAHDAGLAKDGDNRLLWHMNMRRLSAEEIRDSILAVNGTLNLKGGGPSIYPEIPAAVLHGQSQPGKGWEQSSPEEAARRSVFIHVKRSLITPILSSFDFADTDFSCPVRFETTQPTQALGMLNSEFLNQQAELFAKRLRREAGNDLEQQVEQALRLASSRGPTDEQVNRGVKFIEGLQHEDNVTAATALDQFCLLVLNLNEFIYLD